MSLKVPLLLVLLGTWREGTYNIKENVILDNEEAKNPIYLTYLLFSMLCISIFALSSIPRGQNPKSHHSVSKQRSSRPNIFSVDFFLILGIGTENRICEKNFLWSLRRRTGIPGISFWVEKNFFLLGSVCPNHSEAIAEVKCRTVFPGNATSPGHTMS